VGVGDLLSQFLVSLSAVFFIVDPIAVVPIFISMTPHDSRAKANSMALRACLVAGGILMFFAVFGGLLFQLLGTTLPALRVAGGILLLLTALDMLRARESRTRTSDEERAEGAAKDDIAVVPLAIPLLAGPGSIATVMVLAGKGKGWVSAVPLLLAIAVSLAASYLVLRSASFVQRVFKQSGIAIVERVMGLLLAAIAIQFMADGARELLTRR